MATIDSLFDKKIQALKSATEGVNGGGGGQQNCNNGFYWKTCNNNHDNNVYFFNHPDKANPQPQIPV